MYITFNFKCSACGHTDVRMVDRSKVDSQVCRKASTTFPCLGLMAKLPAGTRTHFRFNDTKLKPR